MNAKKLLYIVALLLMAGTILAACGSNEPANQTIDMPDTDQNVEVNAPSQAEEPGSSSGDTQAVEPTDEPAQPPTTRVGGWLDMVSMSIVDASSAVTQLEADAIDIHTSGLATPQDLAAIQAAGFPYSTQFGLYYEIRFNPVGPTFEGTGKLNPFYSAKLREAMNWLIDRDYINQEIYGGASVPKWLPITNGFPNYARYVEYIRPLEVKYAYDFDKAAAVITEEMEALGAEKIDGAWTYAGEQVELIFLIRTDSDGTRRPMGDYVASQLENLGFVVDRQYKTSSEASPVWVLGNPNDGLWHLYTGAWGVGGIDRSEADSFQFHYTPQSSYSFSPLWQEYAPPEEFTLISEAIANADFDTLEEREEMFAKALEMTFDLSYVVWVIDGKSFSPWQPDLEVSYDLGAGVDINSLWPYTLRYTDSEGGLVRWANTDLFVDPPNPIAGSNWTTDNQWQIATSDWDAIPNPFTGVQLPQRIERAELTMQTGLPVTATYDWVSLEFADIIEVPDDVWVDWDVENEVFITGAEKFPDGQTAKRKVVVHYPASLWDITWHDGSPLTLADFVMNMIMTFTPGIEGSNIYDSSQAPRLQSFLSTFKGFKIVSEDPLTLEYYSDTWYLDAEANVVPYRTLFWPDYGYGQAPWHMIAVSNKAEEAGELAYSANKADELEVDWMSYIGGPSLEILEVKLDEAIAEEYIPYTPTLGQYVTAEEALSRYQNLKTFYEAHDHFWVGTGPYILDDVYLVEKTLTLVHNPNYIDLADKWAIFSRPMLAEVAVDGPGRVTPDQEAVFDVFVTYEGEDYPADDIASVKYLLFNALNELIEVGQAELVEDGYYIVTLSAETVTALGNGAMKLEVAIAPIPVSTPSFGVLEFVIE